MPSAIRKGGSIIQELRYHPTLRRQGIIKRGGFICDLGRAFTGP
jgi:hypothetical protein